MKLGLLRIYFGDYLLLPVCLGMVCCLFLGVGVGCFFGLRCEFYCGGGLLIVLVIYV